MNRPIATGCAKSKGRRELSAKPTRELHPAIREHLGIGMRGHVMTMVAAPALRQSPESHLFSLDLRSKQCDFLSIFLLIDATRVFHGANVAMNSENALMFGYARSGPLWASNDLYTPNAAPQHLSSAVSQHDKMKHGSKCQIVSIFRLKSTPFGTFFIIPKSNLVPHLKRVTRLTYYYHKGRPSPVLLRHHAGVN